MARDLFSKEGSVCQDKFFTVFCRHWGAVKSPNIHMTATLCLRRIAWASFKRMIEKGRECLRNDGALDRLS